MNKEKLIQEEVEKTLNSIDKLKNLDANPFLYTRIKTRIEKKSIVQIKIEEKNILLKPIVLVLILVINIITAVFFFQTNSVNKSNNVTLTDSLNKEYQLNQVQNYNYKLE